MPSLFMLVAVVANAISENRENTDTTSYGSDFCYTFGTPTDIKKFTHFRLLRFTTMEYRYFAIPQSPSRHPFGVFVAFALTFLGLSLHTLNVHLTHVLKCV